jgi:hypothetical protein
MAMRSHLDKNFLEACKSLSRHPLVRKALRSRLEECTNDVLRHLRIGEELPKPLYEVYDIIIDTFKNNAPVVKEYRAELSKGVFPVHIIGFPGAYYVWAPEYDDSEIFHKFSDAKRYVMESFGEILVDDDTEDDYL